MVFRNFAAAVGFGWSAVSGAQTYVAATEFSSTSPTFGPWSLGWKPDPASPDFHLMNTFSGSTVFSDSQLGAYPFVGHGTQTINAVIFRSDEILLCPGSSQWSTLRFTAPSAGGYRITFQGTSRFTQNFGTNKLFAAVRNSAKFFQMALGGPGTTTTSQTSYASLPQGGVLDFCAFYLPTGGDPPHVSAATGVKVSITSFAVVSGHVNLGDYTGSPLGVGVRIDFVRPGGTVLGSVSTRLDDQGNYAVQGYYSGTLMARCSGTHWLSQTGPVMQFDGTGMQDLNFDLVNGDSYADNEVNLADFGLITSAFGLFAGQTGYTLQADLDGDGEVGLSDFGILSANFGLIGD